MIFDKLLKWDTTSIQAAMCDYLEKNGWSVSTVMGFSNEGQSAFIDTARKGGYTIVVYLENEAKQIRIKGGIDSKYLPKGEQIPKYAKIFAHTQLKQASEYFEKVMDDLDSKKKRESFVKLSDPEKREYLEKLNKKCLEHGLENKKTHTQKLSES